MSFNRLKMAPFPWGVGLCILSLNLGWPATALTNDYGGSDLCQFSGPGLMGLAASTSSFWNNCLGRSQLPCVITLRLPCSGEAQTSHVERLHEETE